MRGGQQTNYYVQYSDDNTTFTNTNPPTIISVGPYTNPTTTFNVTFNSSGPHRFWRLLLNGINTNYPDGIENILWYYLD